MPLPSHSRRLAALAASSAANGGLGPQINLPTPHPGQRVVRTQERRFNWLCAGRRWRKTTLVMPLMVERALAGGEYGWTAPTYKQVRIGWEEMRRACGHLVTFNESRMEAAFPGGGLVRFASLDDPDNIRGWTLDGFEMDEASEISARAYYEILRPMLMDTGGWGWFTFTPKGQNWVWNEHQLAIAGDDPESMAWQIPSLGVRIVDGQLVRAPHPLENPEIPFSELEDMYARMPERTFQQEIMAEFLEDAGGVFRGVRACIDPSAELESAPPHRMAQYVIGIDLAKHADYTALFVGDLRRKRVVAYDRFNKADWGLQKARIVQLAKHWNDAICWQDSTGVGDPVYDDLRAAGLRIHSFKFSAATKQALIDNAVLMVEQQTVRFPHIPILVNELLAYQYVRSAAGHLKMSAPEGMHDDCVIAFALMCWPMGHTSAELTEKMREQLFGAQRPVSGVGGHKLMDRTF